MLLLNIFLGIFLTDTTFMYENPPLINGLVNVPRVFLLGEKIKQFLLFQKHKYTHLTSMEVYYINYYCY